MLVHLAAMAELHAVGDPNTALFKTRQFAEALLHRAAARVGVQAGPPVSQIDLIRTLELQGLLQHDVAELFHHVRKAGNEAAHAFAGTSGSAIHVLKVARQLAVWFHRTFSDPGFHAGPFVPPKAPIDHTAELRSQLDAIRAELDAERLRVESGSAAVKREAALRREAEEVLTNRLAAAEGDREAALALAEEMERLLAQERESSRTRLEMLRADAQRIPEAERTATVERARVAANALELDEADTRKLIDAQLREAGWEADTEMLRWSAGTRPQRGRDIAIAEWPTDSGPADYVLFSGLTPMAAVEAKRKAKTVPALLGQAERYGRDFKPIDGLASPGGPWGNVRLPFAFASNGRAFLRQIIDQSGVWFRDARRTTNHARALEHWYTPQGLRELLSQDIATADAALRETPSEYLPLRPYQHAAIAAAERAIMDDRRALLLAMATGTGKTRTLLGLVYRLLKAKRFRRVLFLVDRTALGTQALEAFTSVRLEGVQSFSDIYDVKEFGDLAPDVDTRLHIATVQAMVRRILGAREEVGEVSPSVDSYDCVVVDECHRGYVLDRELGDADLEFRSQADYISKYRRVLDHFDAVKIGLTATPALHTTEIFGNPVFTYSYRQAVVDGFLVDHEPPVRIETELSRGGIRWKSGESVPVYDTAKSQVELFQTPDELSFDVEDFNRKVVTENFNRVVCDELARQIDPAQPGKTLIFCATDAHADMVVRLLTEAFAAQYGEVEHDAVVKITAAAPDPAGLLRRYKNERRPVVAVTVDLLTTGVDVPEIVNLVFLRRVKSRILYEQMLGRATRLRPDLHGAGQDKEVFRVFDAVDLYAALEPHTSMTPVVQSAAMSIAQLVDDLENAPSEESRRVVHEQLVASLRRRRRRLEKAADLVTAAVGRPDGTGQAASTVSKIIDELRRMSPADALEYLRARPALVEVFDRHGLGGQRWAISDHSDQLASVEQGYGTAERPEDYLEQFAEYLRSHLNEIPALIAVTQRPRDLTRAQLRELKLTLDSAGYPEAALRAAFRDVTNQDIAASIIGYIRRQALGDPLVPYAERVSKAVQRQLASRSWTQPQRTWLARIGQQLERELVVDREALDREQFREQGGGFDRLNKVFQGELPGILGDLQDAVWAPDLRSA